MPRTVDMGDGREVRRSASGKRVLATNRPNKFGARVRKAFLTHLSGTCNVSASAAAAGCSEGAVYYWQNNDPDFADACDAAHEAGFARLEQMLVERALRGENPNKLGIVDYEAMPDPSQMDTELALRLLSLHYKRVHHGVKRGGGATRRKATREETDAAILRGLKVLRIRFERGED